jgi:hypothetical protein
VAPGRTVGHRGSPLAKGLSEGLGKPFVIENRGGASGNIGTGVVAASAPDGYMLLVTSSSPIVINPSLYKNMAFNPQKDLAPDHQRAARAAGARPSTRACPPRT